MAQITSSVPPTNFGRTFIIGGTVVAAALGGFYMNMVRNRRKQEFLGTIPHHEQVIAHLNKEPVPGEALPTLTAHYSNMPPAFPGKDHHSGHNTVHSFKTSPEYAEYGLSARYMVPPPQRGKGDGSGRPYTKSPDYAKNYEKTARPTGVKGARDTTVNN